MAQQDLSELTPTPAGWLEAVRADFDDFLRDHASCEKKASGMALNVAAHYPDKTALLQAMVDLAVEELNHYREVMRLLLRRGVTPGADTKDPYVNELNALIRRGPDKFMLDRLLVGAVVERRGAERFGLLADSLEDPELRTFYAAIAASEEKHWTLFFDLASEYFETPEVTSRFNELNAAESEIMLELPLRAALH